MIAKLWTCGIVTLLAAGYRARLEVPAPGGTDLPVTRTTVAEVTPAVAPANPIVEIAICLDTSGSMNGLIDAARQKLWGIVNEFVFADPQPRLRVALLTYGNDGHSEENGWVKLETELTEDLDLVSKLLFEQTTNGGTEYVGRVVSAATRQLHWSTAAGALKLIVVAGNEGADQDQSVRYDEASRAAIAADILVNALYCGPANHADAQAWRQVALLADGQFAAIDHNAGTLVVESPFDVQLSTLSTALNGTYLPFGEQGAWNLGNQQAQDLNAAGLNGEAAASRAFCKANGLYNCATWDLVDALHAGTLVLADVKTEELPEQMRSMTLEERQAHIARKGAQRVELQTQVNQLATQRQAFVEAEMKKRSLDESKSFDHAIRQAVRGQAEAKGYRFPKVPAPTPAPTLTPAKEASPSTSQTIGSC
jgi:hypothetical protein